MLTFFKRLLIVILSLFILLSSIELSYGEYITLHPQSSKTDVIKFQKFFKALKIYKGDIDGNYENLKVYVSSFQLKHDIIDSEKAEEAGYIGKKTFAYFEKKYGTAFEDVYKKFFERKDKTPAVGNDRYFIVSAYYSPLKGQKRYSTKSYAGDIRLNGEGTHGASGAGVHSGFIAAPSNYSFGTKIQLEGLGIGVVEDRGGAIVKAGVRGHEYDRLDIWMGYGDAGLTRALNWGKRTVKGKILPKSAEITISFDLTNKPDDSLKILAKKITPESNKTDIKEMQKLFYKAGILKKDVDGKYSSFEGSIIDFQIESGVIKNQYTHGAGYIGNKTINALIEKYPEVFTIRRKEDEGVLEDNKNNTIKAEQTNSLLHGDKKSSLAKKYDITEKQKKDVDALYNSLEIVLKSRLNNNSSKIKAQKKIIITKIEKVTNKTSNTALKNKLSYLLYKLER